MTIQHPLPTTHVPLPTTHSPLTSWDPIWESIYASREWGKYPPEELIRFIARNFYSVPDRRAVKILDLGCGSGAATWYVAREGFSAYGIDGSASAISRAQARFKNEGLVGTFAVGDMVSLPYPPDFFDAVIDICAIQHNTPEHARTIMGDVFRVLKPGGKIFSMLINKQSRFANDTNPFEGKGFVHLYTQDAVHAAFAPFKNLIVDMSTYTDLGNTVSHFVVKGEK